MLYTEETNLFTISTRNGVYDTMVCKICGVTGKQFGFGGGVVRDPEYRAKRYDLCHVNEDGKKVLGNDQRRG